MVISSFIILNLLREDGKDFKNIDSQICGTFIMQQLVTSEEREYRELDLALNQMLTTCLFVPLPKNLELTANPPNIAMYLYGYLMTIHIMLF